MTYKTNINMFGKNIDVDVHFYMDNDSITYEWWGYKESIKCKDYIQIEYCTWDESQFDKKQNDEISDFLHHDNMLNKLYKQMGYDYD